EGAGEGGVKRVIFASSGGVVYGDPEVIPTPETAPKLPVSPYGVSKLAGEFYLRAIGALRGFEGVAMRYANVFGPRQDPKSEAGVVSIFVSRLLEKKPLVVFGDGRQTRDYVFVKDVARANVLATTVALPTTGEFDAPAFNVATSIQRNVLDLAQSVGQVMGRKPELEFAPARPGELFRSSLDIGKAKAVLGWSPEWKFEDGLRPLVEWFEQEAA
ncbi:MAG: NAD-dependent epimerase/dehydratase family protein, partial [Gemmatimonadales bacterium]